MSALLTLDTLVQNIERATDDFSALCLEASGHLGTIAKERAALGEIRERVLRLREPVQAWQRALWDGIWRDDVDRAAYRSAEAAARMLSSNISDLIWSLFDFRKAQGEARHDPV